MSAPEPARFAIAAKDSGLVPNAATFHRCPVCDETLEAAGRGLIVLRRVKQFRSWSRCSRCHSFFAADDIDEQQEVAHIRTRAWGHIETAVSLGEAKSPLFDAILRTLGELAPAKSLLDVGCSYGTFLLRAQAAGYTVRGVDIVPDAVEYVRGLGIACDRAASVSDVDVSEGSFDVITVLDCNCYWRDHRRELRAIYARLRPGGVLAMRVVDTSWAVRLGLLLAKLSPSAGQRLCERVVYDHHVSVPAHSLLKVVSEEGFTVIRTSIRDAVPFRHNPLKARVSYRVGDWVWRAFGRNVAPGLVLFARR